MCLNSPGKTSKELTIHHKFCFKTYKSDSIEKEVLNGLPTDKSKKLTRAVAEQSSRNESELLTGDINEYSAHWPFYILERI